MRANTIRARWDRGEAALDIWLTGTSLSAVEAVGRLGYDAVTLDLQHSAADYRDALAALIALEACETSPLVRVGWNEPAAIMKVLDAGAHGVICPMINTREDAERFVGAVRYPPLGHRSFGAFRVYGETREQYSARANDAVLALAQVETVQSLENLELIVATPGLDAVYIGPVDLSLSGGGPPVVDYAEALVERRVRRIVEVAHAAGVRVGLPILDPADVERCLGWGVDLLSVANELRLIIAGGRAALDHAREAARG